MDSETTDVSTGEVDLGPDAISEVDIARIERSRVNRVRASKLALVLAAATAIAASERTGVGLVIVALVVIGGTAVGLREHRAVARWVFASAALTPWLVIRDNTWLTISIVCTALLVLAVGLAASATGQSLSDFSVVSVLRRPARRTMPGLPRSNAERNGLALFRGVLIALPIVGVFWALLASADDVFAEAVNPAILPYARAGIFLGSLPFFAMFLRFGVDGQRSDPLPWRRSIGALEATVVLSAVSALFATFIGLRIATIGRDFSDELVLRSEVRSGFFQLLWVAVLTVVLVLAIREIAGSPTLEPRLRRLALLTVSLAAIIDGLALGRIASYVEQSFLSPLRFWSFGFGLWLFVVLSLVALRIAGLRAEKRWFTIALVTSWMVFVFAMGTVNPDRQIAEHNFANPPTGEDEWIAVQPLIWLSEDATPTIVENIEALRPMPNNRYERMRDHLCTREFGEGWRDIHFSRRSAQEAVEDLC